MPGGLMKHLKTIFFGYLVIGANPANAQIPCQENQYSSATSRNESLTHSITSHREAEFEGLNEGHDIRFDLLNSEAFITDICSFRGLQNKGYIP